MSTDDHDSEAEAVGRDRDLAWELFDAQPDHPQIPTIVHSVLRRSPQSTGQIILLAKHYQEVDRVDEARELLHDLIGRRDRQYVNAVRELRDLEHTASNFDEAVRLAELVLREEPGEYWMDIFNLGRALTFARSPYVGWPVVDDAVTAASKESPEAYAGAIAMKATHLLESSAPPEMILPVAEAAIALDPTESALAITLAFAYLYTYRFDEAEELIFRVLREDPTDDVAQGAIIMARGFTVPLRDGLATIEEFREAGMGEYAWNYMFELRYGCGVGEALAALDAVMPASLTDALHAPFTGEDDGTTASERALVTWHDGQLPGTAHLWGKDNAFRLLAHAEIARTEAELSVAPSTQALWGDDGPPYWAVVATDDAGRYLVVGPGGRLQRRDTADHEYAPSLAHWLWDQAVSFGAKDPRPSARLT